MRLVLSMIVGDDDLARSNGERSDLVDPRRKIIINTRFASQQYTIFFFFSSRSLHNSHTPFYSWKFQTSTFSEDDDDDDWRLEEE